jgi:FkbM family methyltransferase
MLIPFSEVKRKYNINPTGVIHVGGHWGEEAKDYYDNGVTNTIWIEANPQSMERLIETVSAYPNFNPFLVLNACVSDVDGQEVVFNISNNEGQSSSFLDLEYHKIAHQEVSYIDSIRLKTTTLNTLFKDFKEIKDFTFLNADIQGAELLMLKGATEILPNIECLYLEVNEKELYKGCGLINEIDDFVSKYGFTRVETSWAGNFGWGDAVYLKK